MLGNKSTREDGQHFWLASDVVIPFVEGRQQNRVEADRPDPVGGLFQAERLIDHRAGEKEQQPLEAKDPAARSLAQGVDRRLLTLPERHDPPMPAPY